jgi:hypothetical protein
VTQTVAPLTRYFGKCLNGNCKNRVVIEHSYLTAGNEFAKHRCCNLPMTFCGLRGKFNAKKECGSRCMASTGPSCSCQCGGENHGTNLL